MTTLCVLPTADTHCFDEDTGHCWSFSRKLLVQEIAKAELRGRESMRQESDSLARACNLADVDYATFLKIKAYMPVHPAPKPMTEGDQHDF